MKKKGKNSIRFLTGGIMAVLLSTGVVAGTLSPVVAMADEKGNDGLAGLSDLRLADVPDEEKFKIERIVVDYGEGSGTAGPGEQVRIRALSEKKDIGLDAVILEVQINPGRSEQIYLNYGENDVLEGAVTISDNWSNGSHKIEKVLLRGTDGAVKEYDASGVSIDDINVSGSGENYNSPEVRSVSFDRDKVRMGEYVQISADVPNDNDLEEIFITFKNQDGQTHSVHFKDGKKTITKDLDGWSEGVYNITRIEVIDKAGNKQFYADDDNIQEVETSPLYISNEYDDRQGPVLRDVRFEEKATGSNTNIVMNYFVDAGDSSGVRRAVITLQHESGEKKNKLFVTADETGELKGDTAIDHTWLNGRYTVCEAVLTDTLGNETVYTKDSTPAMPPIIGFAVSNSKEDREAPVLKGIDISGTNLKPGNTAVLTFEFSDKSDILSAAVNVYQKGSNDPFKTIKADVQDDGSYRCEIPVNNRWFNSEYDIRLAVSDTLGNTDNIETGLPFVVSESKEDYEAPRFLWATCDQDQAGPGDILEIKAGFEDDSAIDHIYYELYRVGEDGELIETAYEFYDEENDAGYIDYDFLNKMERLPDGTFHKDLKVSDRWPNGKYVLYFHSMDQWGNYEDEIETDVEVEISGTSEDREGPEILSLKSDKANLSPGDEVKITATAEDPSGVDYMRVRFHPKAPNEELFRHYNPGDTVTLLPNEAGAFEGTLRINNQWLNKEYCPGFIFAYDFLGNESYYEDDTTCFTVSGATGQVSNLRIESVRFDKEEAYFGDEVNVTATVTGQGAVHVKEIKLTLEDDELETGGVWEQEVILTPAEDGTLKGSFKISQSDDFWRKDRTYGIIMLHMVDSENNPLTYAQRVDLEAPGILDLSLVDTNCFEVDTHSEPVINPADYTQVDEALSEVPENLNAYTDESVEVLRAAIAAVVRDKTDVEQLMVDKYAENIRAAIEGLVLKGADYSGVDEALANVPGDLSIYTDETVKDLQTAMDAVERDKKGDEQALVDSYANDITKAIEALELKEADYSRVDELIATVPDDLDKYTDESADALRDVLEKVVRGKKITEQAEVDAYAADIEKAIQALEKKADPVPEEPVEEPETEPEKKTEKDPVEEKEGTAVPEKLPEDKPAVLGKTQDKKVAHPVTGKEMRVVTAAPKAAPSTGDRNATGIWAAAGILSGLAGVAAVVFRKRRKE